MRKIQLFPWLFLILVSFLNPGITHIWDHSDRLVLGFDVLQESSRKMTTPKDSKPHSGETQSYMNAKWWCNYKNGKCNFRLHHSMSLPEGKFYPLLHWTGLTISLVASFGDHHINRGFRQTKMNLQKGNKKIKSLETTGGSKSAMAVEVRTLGWWSAVSRSRHVAAMGWVELLPHALAPAVSVV